MKRGRKPKSMSHELTSICIGAELTPEDVAFGKAMEEWKLINKCRFPSWSQVLEVIKSQGYRRVAPAVAPATAIPKSL